jgi:hypothetical protein
LSSSLPRLMKGPMSLVASVGTLSTDSCSSSDIVMDWYETCNVLHCVVLFCTVFALKAGTFCHLKCQSNQIGLGHLSFPEIACHDESTCRWQEVQ